MVYWHGVRVYTVLMNLKKVLLGKFWYSIKEEYLQLQYI